MSTLIVGGMMVTGMNLLGGVVKSRTLTAYNVRAALFAQEMLCEIAGAAYIDSDAPTFGPETAETTGTRALFDDVDDYNGWSETPLKTRDNTTVANTAGWTRSVAVAWVDPAAPSTVVGSDLGLKRISVTVSRNGQTVATAYLLKGSN